MRISRICSPTMKQKKQTRGIYGIAKIRRLVHNLSFDAKWPSSFQTPPNCNAAEIQTTSRNVIVDFWCSVSQLKFHVMV